MSGGLIRMLKDAPSVGTDDAGFDWGMAADRLQSPVERWLPWQRRASWRFFNPPSLTMTERSSSYAYTPPYYYHGNGPPLTVQDLTAWLWTPETAAAFSLLLLALTIIACCWFSHKIGEWLCTAASGFLATVVLILVLLIFVSQWF